ncbi:MAG: hypothetical protein NWE94_06065 [Candidatus Bathyarchaeota archaeon]|nr:hypothetical protein [Candidatus Bathyarchaeota archaeon]
MSKISKPKKPLGIYLIVLWMTVNIGMLTYMMLTHPEEPNNFIEMALWLPSIAGLWLMKKWGAALSTATLGITLGISLGHLLLAYNSSPAQLIFAPVNVLRIALNAAAFAYLSRSIFANKFR